MLTQIIETLFGAGASAVSGFGNVLGAGVSIFWDSEGSKLTDIGTVGLVVGGIGLAFTVFAMLRKLFKARG